MADNAVVDKDTISKSVTADETRMAVKRGMWLGSFMRQTPLIPMQPDLTVATSYTGVVGVNGADTLLSATPNYEDKWANAISIATTKCAALEYDIDGEGTTRRNRMFDILANVNGMQGWSPFIAQHMQDFLTTDNGAFVEIVRASSSIGSRILGLLHLDSSRCFRTGDPNIPVLYRDLLGQVHPLKAHQVIAICDMPSARATFNGSGMCAARRVYRTIYRMAVIEAYVAEKVDGRRPLSWYLLNGITQKQIDESLKAANLEADAKGLSSFMGAAVTSVPTDEEISLVEIQFSSLPDGFDLEAERSNARLEYANAIGLDIQDLQPGAIGGSLGSSTQSQVLNEKSKGKGLAYWRKAFTEQLNLKVLPSATTFSFVEKDYRDDQMQAQAEGAQADNILKFKNAGMIDAPQAVKIAVDKGLLPPDTVPPEPTPGYGPDGKPLPVPPKSAGEQPNVINSQEKPEDDSESEKAFRTTAAHITPQRGFHDHKAATSAMRAYMRSLVAKCKELCPDDSGAMRESIKYQIKDANTENAEAYLFIGNKSRPEVVVRSNLYGHRGFGPKDPDGVLAFEGDNGDTVFTTHVNATEGEDWLTKAWKATEPERRQLARVVGALNVERMSVGDVPLANAEHIDGYNEDAGETVANTARNRRAGGQA